MRNEKGVWSWEGEEEREERGRQIEGGCVRVRDNERKRNEGRKEGRKEGRGREGEREREREGEREGEREIGRCGVGDRATHF